MNTRACEGEQTGFNKEEIPLALCCVSKTHTENSEAHAIFFLRAEHSFLIDFSNVTERVDHFLLIIQETCGPDLVRLNAVAD